MFHLTFPFTDGKSIQQTPPFFTETLVFSLGPQNDEFLNDKVSGLRSRSGPRCNVSVVESEVGLEDVVSDVQLFEGSTKRTSNIKLFVVRSLDLNPETLRFEYVETCGRKGTTKLLVCRTTVQKRNTKGSDLSELVPSFCLSFSYNTFFDLE